MSISYSVPLAEERVTPSHEVCPVSGFRFALIRLALRTVAASVPGSGSPLGTGICLVTILVAVTSYASIHGMGAPPLSILSFTTFSWSM